jgi:hypothetical protein
MRCNKQLRGGAPLANSKTASSECRRPGSRRQRLPFSQKCRRCPNTAWSLVRSIGTDRNAKRARRVGNCMASYMLSFGCGPLNGPRSNLPISRTIIRTSRIARARCGFRTRSGFIVSWSGPRRIAPERYFKWHRHTNGHKARERVGASAGCSGYLVRRRLTAAADQGHSQRANKKRPQTILPKRLSSAAVLAA